MDFSDSRFSEGGESGWTMYLEHNSGSKGGFGGYNGSRMCFEEEEEGLSMVSDASSCPRYRYDEEEDYNSSKNAKKKIEEHYGGFYQHSSCLEDTASSRASYQSLSLGQNEASMQQVMDYSSQGYSATKFKGKSGTRKTAGFNQFTRIGKQATEEQGSGKQRKKRG